MHDEIREWFPPKADLKANILSGAGQIRALGRLALFANATIVYENLRDLLALARNYRDERPSSTWVHVYEPYSPHLTVALVGSLAGGTGSGIFLDVAFILRQLMRDEDQLFGYFLLPDIYVNRPGTQNVEANAYAALKELDHYMSLEGTARYTFGGREIEIRKKPFDMVFLVNRENRAGKSFTDVEDLVELLGLGLYLLAGPLGKEQADTFDNIVHQLNEQKGKYYGKTAHYASFGAAELRFVPESLRGEARRMRALKILNRILESHHDWVPSELLSRLDHIKKETVEIELRQPPYAKSESENQAIWDQLKLYLEQVRTEAMEKLGERYREKGDPREAILQEAQKAFSDKGVGLQGIKKGLEEVLRKAEEFHASLKAEAKKEEENWQSDLENVKSKAFSPKGNWFAQRRQNGYVISRQVARNLAERARQQGLWDARKKMAAEWEEALRIFHREVEGAIRQLEEYRRELESNPSPPPENAMGRKVEPFTLVLPPPYLEAKGRVEAEATEELWDLNTLLQAPRKALENALASAETALPSLAEWLQYALKHKQEDPELWEAVERTLREVDRISAPAWDYEDAWVSNPGLGYRETVPILGVADASDRKDPFVGEEEILNIFASNLHDRMRLQRVSTGDQQRALFYKIEASIPAFTLRGIQIYREKYEKLARERSFHTHREYEASLADLFPTPSEEEVAEVWTKARALGLLTNSSDRSGYGFADRRQGKEQRYVLGASPSVAFAALHKDFFAFKELEAQVRRREEEVRRSPDKLTELKDLIPRMIENRGTSWKTRSSPNRTRRCSGGRKRSCKAG